MDYENRRSLNDVGVFLTADEAAELGAYLMRLSTRPNIGRVYLSEVIGDRLEREITVSLTDAPRSESFVC